MDREMHKADKLELARKVAPLLRLFRDNHRGHEERFYKNR